MRISTTGLWSLTAALTAVLSTPQRAAAAPCTTGSLASYAVSGFSCEHGGLTFGGFTLVDLAPGQAGNTVPSASSLLVTPTTSAGGWTGFAFSPAISATGSVLGLGESVSVYFGINVNVSLPIGTQLRSTWTDPTVSASGGLYSRLAVSSLAFSGQCYASVISGSANNNVDASANGQNGPQLVAGTAASATSCVGSVFEAAVQGASVSQPGQSGTASMSSFGFEVLTPTSTPVPEPASYGALALGLLLIALNRQNRTASA